MNPPQVRCQQCSSGMWFLYLLLGSAGPSRHVALARITNRRCLQLSLRRLATLHASTRIRVASLTCRSSHNDDLCLIVLESQHAACARCPGAYVQRRHSTSCPVGLSDRQTLTEPSSCSSTKLPCLAAAKPRDVQNGASATQRGRAYKPAAFCHSQLQHWDAHLQCCRSTAARRLLCHDAQAEVC